MNGANQAVGLGGQKAKIVRGLDTRFDLSDAGSVLDPDAGKERQWATVIEGEPGIADLLSTNDRTVKLGERHEGDNTPMFHAHPAALMLVPAPPFRIIDITDIGGAGVRLELEQFGKVNDLTFFLKLGCALLGALHQGELT